MKDRAEIVRVKTFGRVAYQVNILSTETGLYRNSTSRRFETRKIELIFLYPINYQENSSKKTDDEIGFRIFAPCK